MAAVLHGDGVGIDLHAWTHTLQPVHDNDVASVETAPDDPQAVDERAERDARYSIALFAVTTRDEPLVQIGADGAVLNQEATVGAVPGSRSRTNRPGVRLRSVLRKTARARIVPVVGSSWLSRKCMLPFARELLIAGKCHADVGPAARTRAACRLRARSR